MTRAEPEVPRSDDVAIPRKLSFHGARIGLVLALFVTLMLSGGLVAGQGNKPPRATKRPKPEHNVVMRKAQVPPEAELAKDAEKQTPPAAAGVANLNKADTKDRARVVQLPSPEQRQARQQLKSRDSRSAAKQARTIVKDPKFEHVTPAQQKATREAYGKFLKAPVERQSAMRTEIQTLNSLTPAQRTQRMQGADFKDKFSKNERKTIRGLLDKPRS